MMPSSASSFACPAPYPTIPCWMGQEPWGVDRLGVTGPADMSLCDCYGEAEQSLLEAFGACLPLTDCSSVVSTFLVSFVE